MSEHPEPAEPVVDVDAGTVSEDVVPEGVVPEEDHADLPPEPRRYPSTIGGAFYLLILLTAAVGVAVVANSDWRTGVRVLAAGLGATGVLRLLLPERDAGMLAVRHRLVDVALLVGVGLTLYWLAGSIPDQPSP